MRRAILIAPFVAAIAFVSVFAACNSDDDDGSGAPVTVSDIGECPVANGATSINAKYPPSAVPNGGACTSSTSCHVPVDDCAQDWPPTTNRVSEYQCDCTSGTWSCYLAIEGDTPCPLDAGAIDDAAEDAAQAADTSVPSGDGGDGAPGPSLDSGADGDVAADADAGVDASDAAEASTSPTVDAGQDAPAD